MGGGNNKEKCTQSSICLFCTCTENGKLLILELCYALVQAAFYLGGMKSQLACGPQGLGSNTPAGEQKSIVASLASADVAQFILDF